MNERQKELYKLLDTKGGIVRRAELVTILNEYYPRYKEKATTENSTAYRTLRGDVRAINLEPTPKAIVSVKINGRIIGYKLADDSETESLAVKQYAEAMKKLKLSKALMQKLQYQGCDELFAGTEFGNIETLFKGE